MEPWLERHRPRHRAGPGRPSAGPGPETQVDVTPAAPVTHWHRASDAAASDTVPGPTRRLQLEFAGNWPRPGGFKFTQASRH